MMNGGFGNGNCSSIRRRHIKRAAIRIDVGPIRQASRCLIRVGRGKPVPVETSTDLRDTSRRLRHGRSGVSGPRGRLVAEDPPHLGFFNGEKSS